MSGEAEAGLTKTLQVVQRMLVPPPRVADIRGYAITDSIGDPALRVEVILDEDFGLGGPRWADLKPIQDAIVTALQAHGFTEFPYVSFMTKEEDEKRAERMVG